MRAYFVTPGEARSGELREAPDATRGLGMYLVRTLEVGIDGTDRDIHAGEYGEAPDDEQELVIGHEAMGEVVETCPGERCFDEGDLVVPIVRRPDPARCLNCRHGQYDACLTDEFRECGIKGKHGFLRELFADAPDFLVRLPPDLRPVGVLVEPVSIIVKAFRYADAIQSRFLWQPERALIAGAGSIGLAAAVLARLRGLDVLVYSRGAATGRRCEILDRIGAAYVDSEQRELPDVTAEFGAPDLAFEGTGHSPLAWDLAGEVATNGVVCLLSVTSGDRNAQIPSDRLNQHLVMGNRTVFGSVSSNRLDFERAIQELEAIELRWPGLPERFITRRLPMESVRDALDGKEPGEVKTVIRLHHDPLSSPPRRLRPLPLPS